MLQHRRMMTSPSTGHGAPEEAPRRRGVGVAPHRPRRCARRSRTSSTRTGICEGSSLFALPLGRSSPQGPQCIALSLSLSPSLPLSLTVALLSIGASSFEVVLILVHCMRFRFVRRPPSLPLGSNAHATSHSPSGPSSPSRPPPSS